MYSQKRILTHSSLELVNTNIRFFQFLIPITLEKNLRALLRFHKIPFLTVLPEAALSKSTNELKPSMLSNVTRDSICAISGPGFISRLSLAKSSLPLLLSGGASNPLIAESLTTTGFCMICEKGLGAGLDTDEFSLWRNPSRSTSDETGGTAAAGGGGGGGGEEGGGGTSTRLEIDKSSLWRNSCRSTSVEAGGAGGGGGGEEEGGGGTSISD